MFREISAWGEDTLSILTSGLYMDPRLASIQSASALIDTYGLRELTGDTFSIPLKEEPLTDVNRAVGSFGPTYGNRRRVY